jgi:hypothetical protein
MGNYSFSQPVVSRKPAAVSQALSVLEVSGIMPERSSQRKSDYREGKNLFKTRVRFIKYQSIITGYIKPCKKKKGWCEL